MRPAVSLPARPRWRAWSSPSRRSRQGGPRRVSPGAQARSNCWRKRVPTPWTSRRIGLPRDLEKALHAQHIVLLGDVLQPLDEAIADRRARARRRRRCRNRRGRAPPRHRDARDGRQDRPRPRHRGRAGWSGSIRPSLVVDDLHGARHRRPRYRRCTPARLRLGEQVGLVQHDEVGAEQLVLVDLLQRVVVIDRGVGGALRQQLLGIVGEAPVRDRSGIDHRHHAVDRQLGADRGPVEGLDQRLRQRQARGLDDDVVGPRRSRASSASMAGTKSSATVQHRQPLASSTMFSSGQDSMPQARRISPSTPTSPNSLTISARRRPFACSSRWRISVVLPAPRKPVTTVTGIFVQGCHGSGCLGWGSGGSGRRRPS